MLTFLLAVSIVLIVSFLCSIMESVLLSLNRVDVEQLAQNGNPAGEKLKSFKLNIDAPIASILIANTVAHTVGATVAGASYQSAVSADTLWIFSIVFTIAVLLLTEIIPKTLGVSYARQLAVPVAHGIAILSFLLRPMVLISEMISTKLRGTNEAPVTSSEEIRLLAILGSEEGVIGPGSSQIIVRATQLAGLNVRDIMVPKPDVVMLSNEQTLEEAIEVLQRSGFSRVPLSSTHSLDDCYGIVLAKHLLYNAREDSSDSVDWKELKTEPMVLSEFATISQALRAFQQSQKHMALVVEEYGGVLGIVTLEDILEEIVGEIYDEFDTVEAGIIASSDGSMMLPASMEIRKLCDHLKMEWPEDRTVTTLGGLLTEELERLPVPGDTIEWRDLRITALELDGKLAKTLNVERIRN